MGSLRTTASSKGAWAALVGLVRSCLSVPSFSIFETLMAGWVTAPGRATITGMICAADPEGRRAHDAYHRFIRAGRWSTNALWKVLVVHLVAVLAPEGTLVVDCDDTLYKQSGRKVDGAGSFRDAVRSTRKKVVYATGLNLVVVTLRVRAPWGAQPIGVPVGVRLHRKGGPTTPDLAQEIVTELASWLPERSFSLCADGAYASLARRGLPRCALTSRMRRDAALYQGAPPRTGKPGRPRKKGERLEGPEGMATKLQDDQFAAVRVDFRGTERDLLVWSEPVLWYTTDPDHLVLVVIVRDPEGVMRDDFFFTTDLAASPGNVATELGVARSALSNWESDCHQSDAATVEKLDRLYGARGALVDLVAAVGTPVGLDPRRTWWHNYQPSVGPVWAWVRPLPRQPASSSDHCASPTEVDCRGPLRWVP